MKKILLSVSVLFAANLSNAQWSALNSTTTETLNDVDFLNENYGAITGNANTILLTTDGGTTWNSINDHAISGDVYNVKVIGTDSIFVSTFDWMNASTTVYWTIDGGTTWSPVASDPATNHRMDLETNFPGGKLFTAAGNLISSTNYGTSWDTLLTGIAGTLSADLLHFADSQTGHISGNISGFSTYSAFFFRTEDGGNNWYSGDPFSFPNSNALTTMCFVNDDTAYAFMNQYSSWAPSPNNSLVRMRNFNLSVPFPGDTSYTFTSQMINAAMPDYMNDARFEDASAGLALGNTGKVYRTANGGSSWTVDYADPCSTCALLKMDFENGTGYAVGANGILIKYATSTGIDAAATPLSFGIYPNPANGIFNVKLFNSSKALIEIYTVSGQQIKTEEITFNSKFNLSEYPAGMYFIRASSDNGQSIQKIIIE